MGEPMYVAPAGSTFSIPLADLHGNMFTPTRPAVGGGRDARLPPRAVEPQPISGDTGGRGHALCMEQCSSTDRRLAPIPTVSPLFTPETRLRSGL